MWNEPSPELLASIPPFYASEKTALVNKLIYLHFYVGECNWYVAEYNGKDTFFGYAHLGDPQSAEWGYFSFQELREIRVNNVLEVDYDPHWTPKPTRKIPRIIQR